MKKSKISPFLILLACLTMLQACETSAHKVEVAQAKLQEATQNLDAANEEYRLDRIEFRKRTNEKIAANDQSVADFQARIAAEKKEARAEYQAKIEALDQKNSDLKKKMDEFQADGKDGWEKFKTELSHDMETLRDSLNVLLAQNKN